MKRVSNQRVRRKYVLTNEQHEFLNKLAEELTHLSGKKAGVSDVLGGILDFYKLEVESNEKTK